MRIAYYPGCTLKTKAQGLEASATAALRALGVEHQELPRWNCCGAVYSLATDDLLHQLAPVRNLIRALEQGADRLLTLCSQCYNVLARANLLMREDADKRRTLNLFMEEERDYQGEIEVLHLLDFLAEEIGWQRLAVQVKAPLRGLRVAPFYGCSLVRPRAIVHGGSERPAQLFRFLEALGATPVDFPGAIDCCGSYQAVGAPAAARECSGRVLAGALAHGADALVLSCPLCDYNLGQNQAAVRAERPGLGALPVYYFTQLLAMALGLDPGVCHFELQPMAAPELLCRLGSAPAAP
jgi:heterodisulfide reductase subunit B